MNVEQDGDGVDCRRSNLSWLARSMYLFEFQQCLVPDLCKRNNPAGPSGAPTEIKVT